MRRRRPFYLSAPGDIVSLEAEAERLLGPSAKSPIREVVGPPGTLDPALATMLLYRSCFRGGNGHFLEGLAELPVSDVPLKHRPKLIVIPGLNFRRHPETGADGRLVRDIAGRLGAEVELLDPDPRGSAAENGLALARRLGGRGKDAACVISISKGTADFRSALAHLGGWPDWLSTWVNLSGVFQGTPVANKLTRPTPASMLMRAVVLLGGLASRDFAEMRTNSPLWRAPVVPPSPDHLIHVLGFPPPWSVEMRISHHYKWLMQHHGPNDGLIPLTDCFEYPGRIVPVWGADHFMRTPDVARLIYRLARHLDEVSAGERAGGDAVRNGQCGDVSGR